MHRRSNICIAEILAEFHEFFQKVIVKGKVLGPVAHFFYNKEYQACGAPHYHILLWIEDAPIAGRDDSEDVLRWILLSPVSLQQAVVSWCEELTI